MPFHNWLTPINSTSKKIPQWLTALHEHNIYSPFDLLWILPNKFQPIIDEKNIFSLAELQPGQIVRVEGKVHQVYFKPVFFRKARGPLLHHAFAKISSSKYHWKLNAFNLYPQSKLKWQQWQEKEHVTLVGAFDIHQGNLVLNNVKEEIQHSDSEKSEMLIAYPTIKGITPSQWKKLWEKYILAHWDTFPESPPEFHLKKSFQIIHGIVLGTKEQEIQALEKIKMFEFFCEQNLLLHKKENRKSSTVTLLKVASPAEISKLAPWALTHDQSKSLAEILEDLRKNFPMRRMLQGEVGSGKTIIAFLSAYTLAKENNVQIAIIAPTETLARQHSEKWNIFFSSHKKNVHMVAYYASLPTSDKKKLLEKIKNGECQVIIGTHALFQKDVIYKNLRYIIIDEQHRFGVDQRKALYSKGIKPHTLMMSATPIPRSLGLTHFGDLDQSIMTHAPFGEKKIKTRLVNEASYSQFLSFLKTRLALGEQVYIVAPVIEESEHFTYHIKHLETFFKEHFMEYTLTTLHGKMKEVDQVESFRLFQEGKISILIATTMIEVGIDVANATVMAIYHPEQFGLSSLHQLRGRVGRAQKNGFCFLVAPYNLEIDSRERLEFFEKNLDGFVLAEKDFNIRGQGNLWGIQQSGKISSYKVARIPEDSDLLFEAAELAKKIYPIDNLPFPSHLAEHFKGEIEDHYWL